MVKQYKEYYGKTIDLYLGFKRMSFGIYDACDDIDKGHKDRKHINGKTSDHEHGIFSAEIRYKTERHSLKAFHPGKEPVCGDEERYLKEQGS